MWVCEGVWGDDAFDCIYVHLVYDGKTMVLYKCSSLVYKCSSLVSGVLSSVLGEDT